MKCSFAKMSTKGTFEPIWPYGTDLYGRFLYLESGTERVLIAAVDLSGSPPREAARWRREVARRTGFRKNPCGTMSFRFMPRRRMNRWPARRWMR